MIPLKVKLIAGAVGVGLIVLGALYVRDLQVDNAELTRKNGELTTQIKQKNKTIENLNIDIEKITKERNRLNRTNNLLRKDMQCILNALIILKQTGYL